MWCSSCAPAAPRSCSRPISWNRRRSCASTCASSPAAASSWTGRSAISSTRAAGTIWSWSSTAASVGRRRSLPTHCSSKKWTTTVNTPRSRSPPAPTRSASCATWSRRGRGGGPKRIAIVDATATEVGARIAEQLGRGGNWAIRVPAAAQVIDSLTAEVRAKRLDGFLVVTDAALDSGKVEYRGANVFAGKGALQRPVGDALTVVRLQRAGVDPQLVARASIPLRLETCKISRGATCGESAAQSFSLAYFMGIILYTAILLYGINVMS